MNGIITLLITIILLSILATAVYYSTYTIKSDSIFTSTDKIDPIYTSIITDTDKDTDKDKDKDTVTNTDINIIDKPEVFVLNKNIYRFPAAEDACKELNSNLASETDMQIAYKAGLDVCNLGWTEGQLAYYSNYTNKNCKNGLIGKILPPQLVLGANCYGNKPSKNDPYVTMYNIAPFNKKVWSSYDSKTKL